MNHKWFLLAAVWSLAGSGFDGARAEPKTTGAAVQRTIFDASRDFMRFYLTSRKLIYRKADGSLHVLDQFARGSYGGRYHGVDSSLPPADWAALDFDDRDWSVRRAPFFPTSPGHAYAPACDNMGIRFYDGSSASFALLCARGEFEIADTTDASDLELNVVYRGGVVVYLNGQEVARAHVPDTEQKGMEALAEDYPEEVFYGENGEAFWDGPTVSRYAERIGKRIRRLEGTRIPASALRKGRNVLAVQVHRAPYTEKGVEKIYHQGEWSTMGLIAFELKGAVSMPSLVPAAGLQVYALDPVFLPRWDDQAEASGSAPILRIAGTKNGAFNGQLVATSTGAVDRLAVAVSDLVGSGTIPSSAVQIRYLTPDRAWDESGQSLMGTLYTDVPSPLSKRVDHVREHRWRGAAERIPGIMQAIYLTVKIPKDAPPGEYKGTVTVTADGAEFVKVPLELSVADWTLPDTRDFQTEIGAIQSPESVALKYDVELWSDRHWQLLDRVFEFMGQVGCDHLHILLQRRMNHGNSQSMVRWVKKEGGGYTHDFSIVERYVDLAIGHLGRIPVVCLNAWDRADGQEPPRGVPTIRGVLFTVVDPKTGKIEEAEGPRFGTPEAREFWKPVFDGIAKILKDRGLERSMMHGVLSDCEPGGNYFLPIRAAWDDLNAVAPGLKWVMQNNKGAYPVIFGRPREEVLGCFAHLVDSFARFVPDLSRQQRRYGWQAPLREAMFPHTSLNDSSAPALWRATLETQWVCGRLGIARIGFDFFNLPPDKERREPGGSEFGRGTISGRYPETDWSMLGITSGTRRLVNAGKDGPIGTVRLEMLREGAQECEARVFIEKALVDPEVNAKLGPELARRAQALLDRRHVYLAALQSSLLHARSLINDQRQLFEMAAEVHAKLQ